VRATRSRSRVENREPLPLRATQCEDDDVSPSFEYIESRGAHGELGNGVFERLVEARREIWIGSDGSGLIKSTRIGWSFFTDEQRTRWDSAACPDAVEDLNSTIDLFAPGCLSGHHAILATLPTDPVELASALAARRKLNVHRIGELMGEALVAFELRQALYQVVAEVPGADALTSARDELGRSGPGIARVERGIREELIFDPNSHELLGQRQVLVDPAAGYAPPGAVVGWTSYLSRQLVAALPEGTPPVPGPPCSPPGSGRGTLIERGLLLSTGYFTDLAPQVEDWHANGVITDVQYQALKSDT
jgi:hypothetical protein